MSPLDPRVAEGMARTKRPCRYCGREIVASGMTTHEPACSPEGREARKARARFFTKRYMARKKAEPGYVRQYPKDLCECGATKNVTSAHCKDCDKGGQRPRSIEDRFRPKVDRSGGPSACWPFMGARSVYGYGAISVGNGRARIATRVAMEIELGRRLERSEYVLHRCDNPPCCNPAHLWLGTQADNMADAKAKGRLRRKVA